LIIGTFTTILSSIFANSLPSAMMLSKSVAAGLTLGSGGNGGNFGPSLFMGAYLGFSFARFFNQIGFVHIPETNFALVGMAGVLSGIFYSPLSAIFLIAEITGGYELMIPLMIVSALSLAVAKHFEPLSMEAKKLSERLKHSIANRDHFLLSKIELDKLIETDFIDLTQEFKDYDTDFGKYPLPKKGPALLLIFLKREGLFTTIRRSVPHKVEYYKKAVGQTFTIDLSHDVPNEIP